MVRETEWNLQACEAIEGGNGEQNLWDGSKIHHRFSGLSTQGTSAKEVKDEREMSSARGTK